MQARLYGRDATFSVIYPSGFKVPCTETEKCGVDSPLDKARHVLLYNMRLRGITKMTVAGRPRA